MIIDRIDNCNKYFALNSKFKKGFEFIQSFDPQNYIEGKNEISGDDIFAVVANISDNEPNEKLEIHNEYIDIQYVVTGLDLIGWKNRKDCKLYENEFNLEKDYQFLLDKPTTKIELNVGEFAIFYPEDAHSPLMSTYPVLKIIIKIRV